MRHHSVNGHLLLRSDDARVVYHVLRFLAFTLGGAAALTLVHCWTGRWRLSWMTVEVLTLLSILNAAFCLVVYLWKPPRRDLYLRRRPVHSCRACGYNLKGNIDGRCPECGEKNPAHYSRMIGLPFMRAPRLNRSTANRSRKSNL